MGNKRTKINFLRKRRGGDPVIIQSETRRDGRKTGTVTNITISEDEQNKPLIKIAYDLVPDQAGPFDFYGVVYIGENIMYSSDKRSYNELSETEKPQLRFVFQETQKPSIEIVDLTNYSSIQDFFNDGSLSNKLMRKRFDFTSKQIYQMTMQEIATDIKNRWIAHTEEKYGKESDEYIKRNSSKVVIGIRNGNDFTPLDGEQWFIDYDTKNFVFYLCNPTQTVGGFYKKMKNRKNKSLRKQKRRTSSMKKYSRRR